jgi:hypothetical protein
MYDEQSIDTVTRQCTDLYALAIKLIKKYKDSDYKICGHEYSNNLSDQVLYLADSSGLPFWKLGYTPSRRMVDGKRSTAYAVYTNRSKYEANGWSEVSASVNPNYVLSRVEKDIPSSTHVANSVEGVTAYLNRVGRSCAMSLRSKFSAVGWMLTEADQVYLMKQFVGEIKTADVPQHTRVSIEKTYNDFLNKAKVSVDTIDEITPLFNKKWVVIYMYKLKGYVIGAVDTSYLTPRVSLCAKGDGFNDDTKQVADPTIIPFKLYKSPSDVPEEIRDSLCGSLAMSKFMRGTSDFRTTMHDPEGYFPMHACIDSTVMLPDAGLIYYASNRYGSSYPTLFLNMI